MKKLVFVSNFLNHHQIPLSNDFYNLLNGDYRFIQMEQMSEERKKMGWEIGAKECPYLIEYADDIEYAQELIDTAEVVIFSGAVENQYIEKRIASGKVVFKYDERVFKKSDFMWLNPRVFRMMIKCHVAYRNKNVYFLCASAYAKRDFDLFRCYPGKMFSWGYFPSFYDYGDEGPCKERGKILKILWSGRLIDWKHPEIPLELAKKLKKENINFKLTMIANGQMSTWVDDYIKKQNLETYVDRVDSVPNKIMQQYMFESDVFLMTSDRNEGWGAVANEAMNHGCILVANKAAGSIPWLIENEINGFCYNHEKEIHAIINKVIQMTSYEMNQMRLLAYKTIRDDWSSMTAAQRFLRLMNDPEKYISPQSGVCRKLLESDV